MKNYSKGECTLDTISVVEFYKEGTQLNWCQYLLTEMLQACVDAHEMVHLFYLWIPVSFFFMWKWKPPARCSLSTTPDTTLPSCLTPSMLALPVQQNMTLSFL
jgi:hypothetical protein